MLPEALVFADWLPTDETTAEQFQSLLREKNIPFEMKADFGDRLLLPSRAQVIFDDGKLHSVQLTRQVTPAAKKQVSISVPAAVWERVAREARKHQRSANGLCAEWISERATSPPS